jgi:beta-1,4-mannosyltransferase
MTPGAKLARKQVLHMPAWLDNPYQTLLARGLRTAGWEVVFSQYPRTRTRLSVSRAATSHGAPSAIHLHWPDAYFKPSMVANNDLRLGLGIVQIRLDIWKARRNGRRVVWTVHNEVSHESRDPEREIMLNRVLAGAVDKMIFHSENARDSFTAKVGESARDKSVVIPHGNYIGCYKNDPVEEESLRQKLKLQPHHTVLLCFGQIRRYKCIPQVIRAFRDTQNPTLRLIIVGKAHSPEVEAEVIEAAGADPRVIIQFGRIPDELVAPLFALSDAMVFGFERILTSGSALLGMSFGKALILPDSARVLGIGNDNGAYYYCDVAELRKQLDSLDQLRLQEMGEANLCAAEQLNWEAIGARVAQTYVG